MPKPAGTSKNLALFTRRGQVIIVAVVVIVAVIVTVIVGVVVVNEQFEGNM